jgi:hypothetical protein
MSSAINVLSSQIVALLFLCKNYAVRGSPPNETERSRRWQEWLICGQDV